jgi:hypothetical protein
MPVGQSINKTTSIKKQSGLGVPAAGAGGSVMTRASSVFSAPRDTFTSPIITTHQQDTGVSGGMKKPVGKVDSLLSTETWQLPLAGMLRKDFAATSPYAAGADVTASASGPHFVDASGGFLTAGLKVGDVGRWTGFTAGGAGNNAKNFVILALTATDMSGAFLDGSAVAAKAAGDSVTFTVKGKKTFAPGSGHTNDYFTVEEWYAENARSEAYSDAKPGNIAVGLPATGNSTLAIDWLALERSRTGARVLTTPTEATFRKLAASGGKFYIQAAAMLNCTGVQFTIADGSTHGAPVVGSNNSGDISRSIIKVSGQFTGKFDSITYQDFYDALTPLSLICVIPEDSTPTSAFMSFVMGKLKLTNDAPDDGLEIVRTYPFTAEWNEAGGAALAFDQTIITVQDSQL